MAFKFALEHISYVEKSKQCIVKVFFFFQKNYLVATKFPLESCCEASTVERQ